MGDYGNPESKGYGTSVGGCGRLIGKNNKTNMWAHM